MAHQHTQVSMPHTGSFLVNDLTVASKATLLHMCCLLQCVDYTLALACDHSPLTKALNMEKSSFMTITKPLATLSQLPA